MKSARKFIERMGREQLWRCAKISDDADCLYFEEIAPKLTFAFEFDAKQLTPKGTVKVLKRLKHSVKESLDAASRLSDKDKLEHALDSVVCSAGEVPSCWIEDGYGKNAIVYNAHGLDFTISTSFEYVKKDKEAIHNVKTLKKALQKATKVVKRAYETSGSILDDAQ